ncbi:MAG: hypothetical protein ABI583_10680 [Betaproteobacteria bacterium]
MNLSTFSDFSIEATFLTVGRLRRLAFAALIAIGFYPQVVIGAGIKAGPFEIEFRSERSWGGGPSMNPLASYKHARYKLLHNGRAVSFSPGSTNGSKREWFAGDLLEAHFLYSNGAPVVLVCTETGTYLVSDQGGKPVVQHLHPDPATRFQFLDSVAGQPGELQGLNAGPSLEAMGRDLGKTGTLMVLPELNGILDLGTLKFQVYNVLKAHKWVYNDPNFDGFSFDESPTGQARVWWPTKGQFALVRYKYTSGDTVKSFAFELVDLKTDSAYLVPFDVNQTRLTTLADITPDWISHYFQWGGEKLSLKKGQKPLPWIGSLNAASPGNFNYNLQPITPEMQPALMKFLVNNFGAKVDASTQMPHVIGLTIQQQSFKLSYYDSSKTLVLEPEFGSPRALTLQIAQQFNRELAQGKHQTLFTTFAPDGFSQ